MLNRSVKSFSYSIECKKKTKKQISFNKQVFKKCKYERNSVTSGHKIIVDEQTRHYG